MKSNVAKFITPQEMAALMLYNREHVL